MYEVRADLEKNRLYIVLGELEGRNEIEKAVSKIEEECAKLKSGFGCVTDLREYKVADEDYDDEYITRAQNAMVKAGLTKVVRVIKKFGALAHFQFDKLSVPLGYHAQNVDSVEEAENYLDEK